MTLIGELNEYKDLFKIALGKEPFNYQVSLAMGDELPSVISIPTGLGKTAAIVLSWVWRRKFVNDSIRRKTPRRLIYCLPMRVLVEQVKDNIIEWLNRLNLLDGIFKKEGDLNSYDPIYGDNDINKIKVFWLLGGDAENDWDIYPELDQIIIGTQDMLLSRALNRGYSMKKYRWPIHFALLNNDCLWVMDEVQLMGDGLATSAQLQAFRHIFTTQYPTYSIWMSATMKKDWLKTLDFDTNRDAAGFTLELSENDFNNEVIKKRYDAKKFSYFYNWEGMGKDEYLKKFADKIKEELSSMILSGKKGFRTIVVINTIERARKLYQRLIKIYNSEKIKPNIILLHSHFRPFDRQNAFQKILLNNNDYGTIVVCTQVIEAGVDISSLILFTELAPISSMIQRFGRCNRMGEYKEAYVYIVNPVDHHPYDKEDIESAKKIFENLKSVSLADIKGLNLSNNIEYLNVIRKKDIVELFDTTGDLAGFDIDVSRFIRDIEDNDVQVFWREIEQGRLNLEEQPKPLKDELCTVPIIDLKKFLSRGVEAYKWDYLDRAWKRAIEADIYPGLIIMLKKGSGGYSSESGWTGDSKDLPSIIELPQEECPYAESYDDDFYAFYSLSKKWQTIKEHTDIVINELRVLLQHLIVDDKEIEKDLLIAAKYHDLGKAHEVFQRAIKQNADDIQKNELWAKSAVNGIIRYERKGFRHELASAFAMLEMGYSDLSTYLAAAHHGKIRLSIRSLPHERFLKGNKLYSRGILEGDILPAVDFGNNDITMEQRLNLSYIELGENQKGRSWVDRMLLILEKYGPFKLAFYEAMLRIADWKASNK